MLANGKWDWASPLLLAVAWSVTSGAASAADLSSFAPDTPEVSFDVPADLVCRDVTTDAFLVDHPKERLIEIEARVSLLLFHGEPSRIEDVVIEIDGSPSGLRVYDYAPRTQLLSDHAKPIQERRNVVSDRNLSASLGGKLGTDVVLTPTLSGGISKANSTTETVTRLAPLRPIVVSGTTHSHHGVYFKQQPSSQTTLEGEQTFRVTFAAPADWPGGVIDVRCVARGQQKWLFVERRTVWNETTQPVELRLVSHTTPKTVVVANTVIPPTTGTEPRPDQ